MQFSVVIVENEKLKEKIKNICQKLGIKIKKFFTNFFEAKEYAYLSLPDFMFLEYKKENIEILKNMSRRLSKTRIIVFSDCVDEVLASQLKHYKINLISCGDIKHLEQIIKHQEPIFIDKQTGKFVDLEKCISTFCLETGILPHLSGYKYVVYAIMLIIINGTKARQLTKEVYPKVGEKFGATGGAVERAIRHALTEACHNGKISKINNLLEAEVYRKNETISNGQFIFLVADRFLYKVTIQNEEF